MLKDSRSQERLNVDLFKKTSRSGENEKGYDQRKVSGFMVPQLKASGIKARMGGSYMCGLLVRT